MFNVVDRKDRKISLLELSFSFFKIGLTAYGMAILQQIKDLIIGKKWLTREQVDEGIAMVQLYPGPIMYNLGIYCAYRIKGFWGSALASFFFLLPSYILMVFLSWLYFSFGEIAWVKPLFMVLEAMVVGIVLHILLDFGSKYVKDAISSLIAGISFLLLLFKINALWVILIAIIIQLLSVIFVKKQAQQLTPVSDSHNFIPGKTSRRLLAIVFTGLIFIALFITGLLGHSKNCQLLFSMFKIGAVAFGSGFTIMPLLQQEAVISHHWVTMQQFVDGIAFGQITPGPFLITSTFIGYKVSGIWGSAIATFGMFFPSFFYTILITEIYDKIKHNKYIRLSIRGVMAAFTGMLAWVVLSLARVSLTDNILFIWAVGSFILVRYFKVNILWIFLLGILIKFLLLV